MTILVLYVVHAVLSVFWGFAKYSYVKKKLEVKDKEIDFEVANRLFGETLVRTLFPFAYYPMLAVYLLYVIATALGEVAAERAVEREKAVNAELRRQKSPDKVGRVSLAE